jgi:NADPH:quinone reductase
VGPGGALGPASASQPGGATSRAAPAPGERVYTAGAITGTYAELALCPAAQVHRLPETLSFVEGAAVGVPYATAYRALFQRGRAQQGELVLVRGASGGVGLATVQLAVAANLTVHGTAGSPAGRDLVSAQGAALVVDHGAPDHGEALRAASGGRGYDLIVEMAAHAGLGEDLALLAPRGRVIVVGSRGPVEIVPRELMGREADVRGLLLTVAPAGEVAAAHEAFYEGLASGRLRPVVARELPLAEAPRAHAEIVAGPATGKIVLVP